MTTYTKKDNANLGIVISLLLTAEYMFRVVFAAYSNAQSDTINAHTITMAAFSSAAVILAIVAALVCVFQKRQSGAMLSLPFGFSLGKALIDIIFAILNNSAPVLSAILLPSVTLVVSIVCILLVNYFFIAPKTGLKAAAITLAALYTALMLWIFMDSLLTAPEENLAIAVGYRIANLVALIIGALIIVQIIASFEADNPFLTVPPYESYPAAPAPYYPEDRQWQQEYDNFSNSQPPANYPPTSAGR